MKSLVSVIWASGGRIVCSRSIMRWNNAVKWRALSYDVILAVAKCLALVAAFLGF